MKCKSLLGISLTVWTMGSYGNSNVNLFPLADYKPKSRGFDYTKGHIGGFSNQLVEDVGDAPGNEYAFDFEFDYHKKKVGSLEKKFKVASMVNNESLVMYSVEEAYIKKQWLDTSIQAGRIILPWSRADSHWGLGKLNNRRNFDYFEPGEEGLVGVNYQVDYSEGPEKVTFGFFFSPIYVPELNPTQDINNKDRTITSRNPWTNPPASQAEITKGNFKRIEYLVETPEYDDVIYRVSTGTSLSYNNKNFEARGYYFIKPENQISVLADARYSTATDTVRANISTQVFVHHVYGGDFFYRNRTFEGYVSLIAIRPNDFPDGNERTTLYTELKTEKVREDYASIGFSNNNDRVGIGASYIARLSPFDRIKNSLTQDPRWNQAVNLSGYYNFKRYFSLIGDIKYDTLSTDRLMVFKAGYQPTRNVLLSFGVKMIGTPENGESFWSPFENNDQVYGSLRYVF